MACTYIHGDITQQLQKDQDVGVVVSPSEVVVIVEATAKGKDSIMLAVVLLLSVLAFSPTANAFFPNFGVPLTTPQSSTPAPPAPTLTVKENNANAPPATTIRVRKTVQADIPQIAEILAHAVVRERNQQQQKRNKNGGRRGGGGISASWRQRMDQMLTKTDIEALLRGRLAAMEEGQAHWHRISQLYDKSSSSSSSSSDDEELSLSEEDRLKLFWSNNERLRGLIAKASTDTGEDNLWKNHNFVLTPPQVNWFHHLQLTAVDVTTGAIAGFCEVAMLSDPAAGAANDDNDGTCPVTTAVIDGGSGIGSVGGVGPKNDNHSDDEKKNRTFSPGITNLVTAQAYRRQGIATRLLQRTERYIQRYWQAERMGLYVEKDNEAAQGLYQSLGYTAKVTCDGGDFLGEMWYMVKDLKAGVSPSTAIQEAREEAFVSSRR